MGLIEAIKRTFGRGDSLQRERFQKLKGLPKEQAHREAAAIFYDLCAKRAADFVNQELRRGDSPFKGTAATPFFHEILAVTFWLMDKEIDKGKKAMVNAVHAAYFEAFSSFDPAEKRHHALIEKYRAYDGTWNEVTGHQDQFGLTVAKNIVGTVQDRREQERTFWIIRYAHETMKSFSRLKKTLAGIGFKP